MTRLIAWVIGAPLALIILLVSVANRAPVTFSLDPFSPDAPAFALEVPLYILLFAALFCGLMIGWMVAWASRVARARRMRHSAADERLSEAAAGRNLAPTRP